MKDNQKIAFMVLFSFILGYGYGIIDYLSGFDKIQISLSASVVVIALIVIFLYKPEDANCTKNEVKE